MGKPRSGLTLNVSQRLSMVSMGLAASACRDILPRAARIQVPDQGCHTLLPHGQALLGRQAVDAAPGVRVGFDPAHGLGRKRGGSNCAHTSAPRNTATQAACD